MSSQKLTPVPILHGYTTAKRCARNGEAYSAPRFATTRDEITITNNRNAKSGKIDTGLISAPRFPSTRPAFSRKRLGWYSRGRKLKIAQIAPLWIRVPPVKYGGTELIVYHLCEELVRRGHDVTLFGPGNSKTSAKLVAGFHTNLLSAGIPWTNQFDTLRHLAQAFAHSGKFDLIHSHVDLWETFFAYFSQVPVVHTMHNPLYSSRKDDLRLQILSRSRWSHVVTISNAQYRLGTAKLNRVGTVYNGLDISKFRYVKKGGNHCIWIARVDPYKGIENAIAACEQANVPLVMAGRLDASRKKYFREKIKPHLNRTIRFIGEINTSRKNSFFGGARALLYPIEWHEPFGLVMIEAMACGTPVIAFDWGSVREVVKDGVTGFVVKTIPEMVRAMKRIDTIDRAACRRWVEEKFTVEKMVDGYEGVYQTVLQRWAKSKRSVGGNNKSTR